MRLLEARHDAAGPFVPILAEAPSARRRPPGEMIQAAAVARQPAWRAAPAPPGVAGPACAAAHDYREDERLALYDWMAPDGPEAQLLADPSALWIEAEIRGDLYELKWGRARGLRLRATAPPVGFRILCSRLLPRRLPVLDAWSNRHYRRVTAEADCRGLQLRTQIYVLKETGLY